VADSALITISIAYDQESETERKAHASRAIAVSRLDGVPDAAPGAF
jgi:hypothetical protein